LADESTKLNRIFIGKEYHVSPQGVDADSIRKYALATNEKNPRYLGTESAVELAIPPIYPVVFLPDVLSQLRDDSEGMNFNILRAVHADQKMRWRGTLKPGDKVHTTAKIANIETRGVNEILDLLIHMKRDDDIVVEIDYRILVRGEKKAGERKPSVPDSEPKKGKVLVKHESIVTADQGVRYAEASGDHNPIHKSDEIAQSVGLPRSILHGLCTMALASQAVVEGLLEGDPKRLKSIGVRFSRPVLMNQTLTTEVYDGGVNKEGLHVVYFETRDEADTLVLTHGTAEYSDY